MALYRKELGRIFKSFAYIFMAVGLLIFANTQGVFPPDEMIEEPQAGARNYGYKESGDPELIMPEAASSLYGEFTANQYTTYPNGFVKYVKLGAVDRDKMRNIIEELFNGNEMNHISWERFSELMAEADDLLGGGSDYSETWISHRFGEVPITYEEALADYELILTKDKLTGTHARLFSDYMGIILGLIPVFPVVFLCLRDQKNIAPMIYTRDISSIKFILVRFAALITAVMIPIFVMCGILTLIHGGDYGWKNIDVLAYFKYALIWQLPTAMVVTALGLFLTTATSTPIAIAVQLIWWFVDTMGGNGSYSFFGIQPLGLIPRHNAMGRTQAYLDYLPQLIRNRIILGLGAIIMVVLTIIVFSAKRRGLFHVSLRKRSKIQPEV